MLLIHYHLFKNAGTSVDRTFRENFPGAWAEVEAAGEGNVLHPQDVAAFVTSNPHVRFLSSHTAVLPLPDLGSPVLPILFLRHPLDRVRSVYDFERVQDSQSLGAQIAKRGDIAYYVDRRLSRKGDRTIADFQAHRLAFGSPGMGTEATRAVATLERLPFIGLVEEFDASIARLNRLVKTAYPDVALRGYRLNRSAEGADAIDVRLASLRTRLGDELYARLEQANEIDIGLWEAARALAERSSPA